MRDTVRGRRNNPCLPDRMGGGPRGATSAWAAGPGGGNRTTLPRVEMEGASRRMRHSLLWRSG